MRACAFVWGKVRASRISGEYWEDESMPMVACRECGKKVSDYAKVCPKCGGQPTKDENGIFEMRNSYRCTKCEALITKKVDNCPNCGASQAEANFYWALVPVIFAIWYLFFR
jgi:RNA polymerase subunit RPABC4/transcription elongation factor Spt4